MRLAMQSLGQARWKACVMPVLECDALNKITGQGVSDYFDQDDIERLTDDYGRTS